MRLLVLAALLPLAALSQSADRFEADVHPSPSSDNSFNQFMRDARGEIRNQNRDHGGSHQRRLLERFDITGKLPAGSTRDREKEMLKTQLAEVFHLAARADSKPMPAYVMTVGKRVRCSNKLTGRLRRDARARTAPGRASHDAHRGRLPRPDVRGNCRQPA